MAELLARNRGYGDTDRPDAGQRADLQKLHYAFVLRNLRDGWTLDQRKIYFHWLDDARKKSGGASYQGFLNNIEKEAFDNATDAERLAIEAAGLRKPYQIKELPKPQGPGRDWTLDELGRVRRTQAARAAISRTARRCSPPPAASSAIASTARAAPPGRT